MESGCDDLEEIQLCRATGNGLLGSGLTYPSRSTSGKGLPAVSLCAVKAAETAS